MDLNLKRLEQLITERVDEIETIVAGSGYLPRTVIGVVTFLLDNEGNIDLLTYKQQATFERFVNPLLDVSS